MRRLGWVVVALLAIAGLWWTLAGDRDELPREAESSGQATSPENAAARQAPRPRPSENPVDGGVPVHALRVRVLDEGRPAPAATILIDGVPQPELTAEDGTWLSGRVQLPTTLGARRGTQAARRLVVSTVPDHELVLGLQSGATLEGEVDAAEGGVPIEGATVMVQGQTVRTDAHGFFAFHALAPEQSGIEAAHPDHVSFRGSVGLEAGATQRLKLSLSRALELQGAVVERGGAPIPGARVEASAANTWEFTPATQTDAAGRFSMRGLPPGPCYLFVDAPGFSSLRAEVMLPAPGVRLVLLRGAELSGHVTAADGTPVAAAMVALTPAVELTLAQLEAHHQATGPGGGYRFEGLAPGRYRMQVTAPGTAAPPAVDLALADESLRILDVKLPAPGQRVEGTVVEAGTGAPLLGARVSVVASSPARDGLPSAALSQDGGTFTLANVPEGEVQLTALAEGHLPQTLPAQPRLRFELEPLEELSGRVVDGRGAPIGQFTAGDVAVRAADGRFRIPRPQGATVTVAAEGFVSRAVSVPPGARGQTVSLGDIALDDDTHWVEVRVLDPDGRPAPGALIFVTDKPGTARQDVVTSRLSPLGMADAEGLARFHLSPRKSCLFAHDPRYPPALAEHCPVSIPEEGGSFTLRFPRAASVHGHVYRQGKPAPGMHVYNMELVHTETDSEGAYRLEPLSPGRHLISSSRPLGGGGMEKDETLNTVALKEGEDLELDLGSKGNATLEVEVLGCRDDATALVRVIDGDTRDKRRFAAQDATNPCTVGRAVVVLPGLSAGAKSVFAFRGSDKSPHASKLVQLPESGTVRVTLELPR